MGGWHGEKRERDGIRGEGKGGDPKVGSHPDVRNPENTPIAELHDLIGGFARQTFSPGGKHLRAATGCRFGTKLFSDLQDVFSLMDFYYFLQREAKLALQVLYMYMLRQIHPSYCPSVCLSVAL